MAELATGPLQTQVPSKDDRSNGWIRFLGRLAGGSTAMEVKKSLWGHAFVLPWILGLLIFWIGPIIASFYYSFTAYDVLSPPRWIGLDNYVKAFTDDRQFWPSLWRTTSA